MSYSILRKEQCAVQCKAGALGVAMSQQIERRHAAVSRNLGLIGIATALCLHGSANLAAQSPSDGQSPNSQQTTPPDQAPPSTSPGQTSPAPQPESAPASTPAPAPTMQKPALPSQSLPQVTVQGAQPQKPT